MLLDHGGGGGGDNELRIWGLWRVVSGRLEPHTLTSNITILLYCPFFTRKTLLRRLRAASAAENPLAFRATFFTFKFQKGDVSRIRGLKNKDKQEIKTG